MVIIFLFLRGTLGLVYRCHRARIASQLPRRPLKHPAELGAGCWLGQSGQTALSFLTPAMKTEQRGIARNNVSSLPSAYEQSGVPPSTWTPNQGSSTLLPCLQLGRASYSAAHCSTGASGRSPILRLVFVFVSESCHTELEMNRYWPDISTKCGVRSL